MHLVTLIYAFRALQQTRKRQHGRRSWESGEITVDASTSYGEMSGELLQNGQQR